MAYNDGHVRSDLARFCCCSLLVEVVVVVSLWRWEGREVGKEVRRALSPTSKNTGRGASRILVVVVGVPVACSVKRNGGISCRGQNLLTVRRKRLYKENTNGQDIQTNDVVREENERVFVLSYEAYVFFSLVQMTTCSDDATVHVCGERRSNGS